MIFRFCFAVRTALDLGMLPLPSLAHQQQSRFAFRSSARRRFRELTDILPLDVEAVLFIDTFKIQLSWTYMTDRPLTGRTIIFSI
jgi:hypothetical protein